MRGYGAPPNAAMRDRLRAKPPKNLKDVPRFLKETVGGTLSRLLYIFRLVWECKASLMIFLIIMMIYDGIMPTVGTVITANLAGKVVESFTQPTNLWIPLLWQFGFMFLNAVTTNLSSMVTTLAGEAITNHIKIKIMNKAKTVDVASFDCPDFYERLENANREAGMRPIHILRSTFTLISYVISMLTYVVLLFGLITRLPKMSYLFFVLFVVFSGISAAVSFHYKRQHHNYMFMRSKDRRQMTYYSDLLVNKDMVKEVRLFDLSDLFIGKYNTVFRGYYKGIRSLVVRESLWRTVLTLVTTVMNGVLFYMIATNVSQIADYTVYTGALNAISAALTAVISNTASIYEGSLFIENMILFMNEKQTLLPSSDTPPTLTRGIGHTIELKNVSFRYPGAKTDVLKNINFTFHAGDTVVLVGLNGAGKTTLIKLITRLYDPTEGVILLDGRDIREYDLKDLYALFGIIFQDFGKYAETVGTNITLGNVHKEKNEESLQRSAAAAGADAFIDALSSRYDTPLTRYFEPDGTELSIGQWQKLSIARAFYSGADILILDEPTASLDALAEQEIYNQFDALRKNKTSIFVSHRLSSATGADVIMVLENGQIVESGNHQELMEKKGVYHHLFSTQAARYQKEV